VAGCLLLLCLAVWREGLVLIGDAYIATGGVLLLAITCCGLTASVLSPGGLPARIFNNSILRFFGRYSYGMYVYHYTLASVGGLYLRPILDPMLHSHLLGFWCTGMIVAGTTVALAFLSFQYFERPILSLKRFFQDNSAKPKLNRTLLMPASSLAPDVID